MSTIKTEEQTYSPDYFSPFTAIEKKHFWFRARSNAIAALTSHAIARLPEGFRVLEGGCGTGNVLQLLRKVCTNGEVYGLDLYREGYLHSRSNIRNMFVQGNVIHPPFSSEFDLVGLFDVIEHITDDIQLLITVSSILRPEGKLLLTVPAHMSLWSYFDEAYFHRRRYSIKELRKKLDDAGFEIDYISEYMCVTFPFIWMARRLAKLINNIQKNPLKNNYELAKNELRIVPVINEVISWMFVLEKFFIIKRIKIPFGSSIIVLARKQLNK